MRVSKLFLLNFDVNQAIEGKPFFSLAQLSSLFFIYLFNFVFPESPCMHKFPDHQTPSKLPNERERYCQMYVLIFQARSLANILRLRVNGAGNGYMT